MYRLMSFINFGKCLTISLQISAPMLSLYFWISKHIIQHFFFSFLEAAPHSMWDLSSPNRNQTLQLKDRVLTTGSLRKSHTLFKLSLLLLCSVPLFPFFFSSCVSNWILSIVFILVFYWYNLL